MDLLAIGGPHATKGFGRATLGSAQARAETAWREIFLERSCSAYRLRCQFRHAVAECLATTRHRFPPGAILSGSSEKTHATPRASAGPDLDSRSRCQWLSQHAVHEERIAKEKSKALSEQLLQTINIQGEKLRLSTTRLDALGAATVLEMPENEVRRKGFDPTPYFVTAFIKTGKWNYRFTWNGKPDELVASFWQEGQMDRPKPTKLRWHSYSLALNPNNIRYVYSLNFDELHIPSTTLGGLQDAKATFLKSVYLDGSANVFHPEYIKSVEAFANPGQQEIPLLCFDLSADDWETVGSTLNLKPHAAAIISLNSTVNYKPLHQHH